MIYLIGLIAACTWAGERQVSQHLPLLKKMAPIQVEAASSVPLQIQLESGWEINSKAPSWMALFKKDRSNQFELVQEFKRSDLAKLKLSLPSLKVGEEYRLQGTIYFCKEGAAAACSVESRDMTIHPAKGTSAEKKVLIQLGSHQAS